MALGILATPEFRGYRRFDHIRISPTSYLDVLLLIFDIGNSPAIIYIVSSSLPICSSKVQEVMLFRTIQFVGITAFHTRISDPLIGGTYMTVCFQLLWFLYNDFASALEHVLQPRRNMAKVVRSEMCCHSASVMEFRLMVMHSGRYIQHRNLYCQGCWVRSDRERYIITTCFFFRVVFLPCRSRGMCL